MPLHMRLVDVRTPTAAAAAKATFRPINSRLLLGSDIWKISRLHLSQCLHKNGKRFGVQMQCIMSKCVLQHKMTPKLCGERVKKRK